MRRITSHKLTGLNDAIEITVLDEPGSGGASHRYRISHEVNLPGVPTFAPVLRDTDISFQEGPIADVGVNGISNEALLAIVVDRLQCFQKGQFSCRENALALTKLEEAMHWLQHRTRERLARGVEGTSVK